MSDSYRQGKSRVSVIIPFLNAERFLVEAIENVLAQTYSDWELMLVDDGSTDGSTRIAHFYAEKYPGQVRYLEHEEHRSLGMSTSRNLGIRHCKGRYVAFLDSDDVWLPHKLERQVAIMESEPRASMVYGLSQYWYSWTGDAEDRKRDFVPDSDVPTNALYASKTLLSTLYPIGSATPPSMSNLLTVRELFERTGGFEERFRGIYEDLAFLVKAYLFGSGVFVSGEQWVRSRIYSSYNPPILPEAAQSRAPRMVFLNWVETYLDQQCITDHVIRSVVHLALEIQKPKEDIHHNGWFLRLADSNEADVGTPPERPDAMRIVVWKCASQAAWDIQMNLPRLRLKGRLQV
jgi:glycosyltransferase involved in cell wall biosynthesis